MHKLLQRQLRRCFGDAVPTDANFATFIETVSAAYRESERDRALLERSMDLASAELLQRNARLEQDLLSIKRLEMELRLAEKLRAVGQLASGIAHEINTPVQFLGDSLRFLKDGFADLVGLGERGRALCEAVAAGEDVSRELATIRQHAEDIDLEYLMAEIPKAFDQTEEGVRRVSGIVLAMKEFGRADQREKVPVVISRCIENALVIAQSELKFTAVVELDTVPVPAVPGHPGEINQVLLNLLVNASHAIFERWGGGRLGLIRVSLAREDDWVRVSVSDNGAGIQPEHQARIFEPFFTTKEVGKGTGQGLAIAHSIIVDKHGGLLTFSSTLGEGTTFTLKLPVHGDTSDTAAPSAIGAR